MRVSALIGICLTAALVPAAHVFAAEADLHIDCGHFQRLADGNWHGDAKAEVIAGGSHISLADAVLSRKDMLIDGVALAARLDRLCRRAADGDGAAQPASYTSKK